MLRRMARGVVEKAAGRNAKAVRGEGGGRRRDGPQGVRCGTGKGGGGCGWRAKEAGKLLVSAMWAMTHAAWNALVHALIGNTGVTCHGCGGVGHLGDRVTEWGGGCSGRHAFLFFFLLETAVAKCRAWGGVVSIGKPGPGSVRLGILVRHVT